MNGLKTDTNRSSVHIFATDTIKNWLMLFITNWLSQLGINRLSIVFILEGYNKSLDQCLLELILDKSRQILAGYTGPQAGITKLKESICFAIEEAQGHQLYSRDSDMFFAWIDSECENLLMREIGEHIKYFPKVSEVKMLPKGDLCIKSQQQ